MLPSYLAGYTCFHSLVRILTHTHTHTYALRQRLSEEAVLVVADGSSARSDEETDTRLFRSDLSAVVVARNREWVLFLYTHKMPVSICECKM